MLDSEQSARKRQAKEHIFLEYILAARYALSGHYLVGTGLAWKCIWCGGRIEGDASNLLTLHISVCLSQQCTPELNADLMETKRIPYSPNSPFA